MKAILSVLCVTLAGCASFNANYLVGLETVERPADAMERFGAYEIVKADSGVGRYVFEDELMRITWMADALNISFSLENKSEHSLRILWDEAAFVDPDGESHRVMHSGVRYIERDAPQAPSIVARGARLTDIVHPTSRVGYVSGYGWGKGPIILPSAVSMATEKEDVAAIRANKGKAFQVLFPVQAAGVTNEYMFTFRILEAEPPELR